MAGRFVDLTASDSFRLRAWRAEPDGTPVGAVVVLQEIFGVNDHIRRVADGYAEAGYVAIAPALFDRYKPGLELGYGPEDRDEAMAAKAASKTAAALLDVAAAREAVASSGKVAAVGFCWGGFLAWLAATRLPGFAAAVSYYGGGMASTAAEQPRCPVLAHFGERDKHITAADVDTLRRAHPEIAIHVYPADHGFNCDARAAYDPPSAELAHRRSLAFLGEHLTG